MHASTGGTPEEYIRKAARAYNDRVALLRVMIGNRAVERLEEKWLYGPTAWKMIVGQEWEAVVKPRERARAAVGCNPATCRNPKHRHGLRSNPPTPGQAKKIVAEALARLGLPIHRLSAKTVGFTDLARGSKLFVTIHGWKPDPRAGDLERIGQQNGFIVSFSGPGMVGNISHHHGARKNFNVGMAILSGATAAVVGRIIRPNPTESERIAKQAARVRLWEKLYSEYMAKWRRIEELEKAGRYGYQLRMPYQALKIAKKRLEAEFPEETKGMLLNPRGVKSGLTYRFMAYSKTGSTLAMGSKVADVIGLGPRLIVDFRKRRYAIQEYYPGTIYNWTPWKDKHRCPDPRIILRNPRGARQNLRCNRCNKHVGSWAEYREHLKTCRGPRIADPVTRKKWMQVKSMFAAVDRNPGGVSPLTRDIVTMTCSWVDEFKPADKPSKIRYELLKMIARTKDARWTPVLIEKIVSIALNRHRQNRQRASLGLPSLKSKLVGIGVPSALSGIIEKKNPCGSRSNTDLASKKEALALAKELGIGMLKGERGGWIHTVTDAGRLKFPALAQGWYGALLKLRQIKKDREFKALHWGKVGTMRPGPYGMMRPNPLAGRWKGWDMMPKQNGFVKRLSSTDKIRVYLWKAGPKGKPWTWSVERRGYVVARGASATDEIAKRKVLSVYRKVLSRKNPDPALTGTMISKCSRCGCIYGTKPCSKEMDGKVSHGFCPIHLEEEKRKARESIARMKSGKNPSSKIPAYQIRNWVGKFHVGTPDAQIEAALKAQIAKSKDPRWTPATIRQAVAVALKEHHHNLTVYRQVMTGRF